MDWEALYSDSGWDVVDTPSTTDTGPIDLRMKQIGSTPCLRGVAVVDVAAELLYEVITDVPSAKSWSSETLLASKVLGSSGGSVEYYQFLDVPNWTMAADRFWVLRGKPATSGALKGFQWQRFDWRTAYPDLSTEITTTYPDAVEPDPNWGAWLFGPGTGGTTAQYLICTNPGGSLPEWLQKAAATKTLPNTMADVVREAKRRAK